MFPYITIVLPSYTVMALIGGFVALCFIYFRLDKFQIEFTTFLKIFVLCVVGVVVGSKLLFAITQIPWLISNFSFMNLLLLIPQSGFVFYGGLFGAIFAILFITRKDKLFRKNVFQLIVPAMPLFHAFGRIGCFLSGCCYGKELASNVVVGPIVFHSIPVQLIEALLEFVLFFVIWHLDKKKPEVDLLKIYLVSYAMIRFGDEFLRGDAVRGIFLGVSTAQWISLGILLFYFKEYIGILRNKHSLEINV